MRAVIPERELGRIADLLVPDRPGDDPHGRVQAAYKELRQIIGFPCGGVLRFSRDFSIEIACDFELDPQGSKRYLDHFWQYDPFVIHAPCFQAPNRAIQYTDFVDYSELDRTAFGAFIRKIPYFHPMAVVPFMRGMPFGAVALHRGRRDGEFDANDRRVLERFAQGVVNCFELAQFGTAVANDASVSLVVFNPDGHIVCISDAALFLLLRLPKHVRLIVPSPDEPAQHWIGAEYGISLTSYKIGPRSLLAIMSKNQMWLNRYARSLSFRFILPPARTTRPFVLLIDSLSGMNEVRARLSLLRCTQREREIVLLLLTGESNKKIATTLGISLPTLKEHLTHVYAKSAVRNRDELVATLLARTLRE